MAKTTIELLRERRAKKSAAIRKAFKEKKEARVSVVRDKEYNAISRRAVSKAAKKDEFKTPTSVKKIVKKLSKVKAKGVVKRKGVTITGSLITPKGRPRLIDMSKDIDLYPKKKKKPTRRK